MNTVLCLCIVQHYQIQRKHLTRQQTAEEGVSVYCLNASRDKFIWIYKFYKWYYFVRTYEKHTFNYSMGRRLEPELCARGSTNTFRLLMSLQHVPATDASQYKSTKYGKRWRQRLEISDLLYGVKWPACAARHFHRTIFLHKSKCIEVKMLHTHNTFVNSFQLCAP